MPMPYPSLAALLDQELAAVVAVQAALEAERAALESRDAPALLCATDRKSAALEAVAQLEAQRTAGTGIAATDAAGPAAAGPVASSTLDLAAATGLRRRTDELRTLTRHCQQLNEANGALIRAQRQRVAGLLQVLTGGVSAEVTYRSDGMTGSHRNLRGPLATA